jgi:hypothetical protein
MAHPRSRWWDALRYQNEASPPIDTPDVQKLADAAGMIARPATRRPVWFGLKGVSVEWKSRDNRAVHLVG